jgi:hypothetical protein
MKAIFIGTLVDGFELSEVVDNTKAEDIVIAHLANGKLAEALDVQDPSSLDKSVSSDPNGNNFVVYGYGLGGGHSVYGPFAGDFEAEEFAKKTKNEGDDCDIFEVISRPSSKLSPA